MRLAKFPHRRLIMMSAIVILIPAIAQGSPTDSTKKEKAMARLPQINCEWPNQSLRLETNLTNLINHDFNDSLLEGVDLLLPFMKNPQGRLFTQWGLQRELS